MVRRRIPRISALSQQSRHHRNPNRSRRPHCRPESLAKVIGLVVVSKGCFLLESPVSLTGARLSSTLPGGIAKTLEDVAVGVAGGTQEGVSASWRRYSCPMVTG